MSMHDFKREGKVQSTMSLEKNTGVFVNDLNERPRTYLLWPIWLSPLVKAHPVPQAPLSLFVLGRNFHSFTPIHSSYIGSTTWLLLSAFPLRWAPRYRIPTFASHSGLYLLASAHIKIRKTCSAHMSCLEPTKARLVLVCPPSDSGGLATQRPRLAAGGQIPKLCPRKGARAEELGQI